VTALAVVEAVGVARLVVALGPLARAASRRLPRLEPPAALARLVQEESGLILFQATPAAPVVL
jgi:hypothetical protein